MNESLPEVTETIRDAALQILTHSFAIYRVQAGTAAKIRAAHQAAAGFFRETAIGATRTSEDSVSNSIGCYIKRYRSVKNGNLYGYNVPLQSKELFRTWYDSGSCSHKIDTNSNTRMDAEERALKFFRRQQPWPSNEFCVASFNLAKDLHRLLLGCLEQLSLLHGRPNKVFREEKSSDYKDELILETTQDPPSNRRPISSSCKPRKHFRTSSDVISAQIGSKCDKANRTKSVNRPYNDVILSGEACARYPSYRPTRCPLDFFFYHNRIPSTTNCSEHIDRGALVVVCLTDVPGLEVRSSTSQASSFQCPEVLLYNRSLYRERTNDLCYPGVVCIMAGDQLNSFLSSAPNTAVPSACIHRVRNPLKRARLSISYELRLKDL